MTDQTPSPHATFEIAPYPLPHLPMYHFGEHAPIHGGLAIAFHPHQGDSWLGIFEQGPLSNTATTGVFAMPNQTFLVAARGDGYIINPRTPDNYEIIDINPISQVKVLLPTNLVLITDGRVVSSYGASGHRWTTHRIAIETLVLGDVSNNASITCIADEDHEVSISLDNGQITG